MSKIFVTSDSHFGHDREFIWGPRGFESCEAHDKAIIERWNAIVAPEDDVYLLGDVMLGDSAHGMECLYKLNGKIHIVRGNHDTDKRIELYKAHPKVVEVANVIRLKYNKIHFYLSHYPTITSNLEKESIYQCEINLMGHTHQQTDFYNGLPFCYHVGMDSHNCTPILLDDIITEIKAEIEKCKEFLE